MTKYRDNGKPQYLTMSLHKLNRLIGKGKYGKITNKPFCIQEANEILTNMSDAGLKLDNAKRETLLRKVKLLGDEDWVSYQKTLNEPKWDNFTNNLFNAEIDTIIELLGKETH